MQTFLPLPDFKASALVLDRQRLGKQRVEVLQLLRALAGETKGWTNHPAAKMWRGYEAALCAYGIVVCSVWRSRGYSDTCMDKIVARLDALDAEGCVKPPWLGRDDFHAAHRSNLLRKDPIWYGQWGWSEGPDLEYIWP